MEHEETGIRYEDVVDRTPVSHVVASFLGAVALFGGLAALFYYPGRTGTSAIVIGLIAAGIGGNRRFLGICALVAALGWLFGMVIAVALERPLF